MKKYLSYKKEKFIFFKKKIFFLKKKKCINIYKFFFFGFYLGNRHLKGLPTRGQRT
jgi:hypothetical protein